MHTYSSLNKEFIPHYQGTLDGADRAMIYFDHDVLKRKQMPALSVQEVKELIGLEKLEVYDDVEVLETDLRSIEKDTCILLLMTSGNFSGLDLKNLASELVMS